MGFMSIVKKTKEKEKEMRPLVLGLDNAGKTIIMKKFNGQDIDQDKISPTLGFNMNNCLIVCFLEWRYYQSKISPYIRTKVYMSQIKKPIIPNQVLSLRQSFTDPNYAWDLLQAQVRLETSQIETLTGGDISNLLQLYMRGVQRMNSLVDIRESFFKNKVTTLMSRTTVIKTLNKPMTKKSKPAIIDCVSPIKNNVGQVKKQQINYLSDVVSPSKIINPMKQLQLKQKKQSMQMRLAYSAQQNNQDKLKKLMAEQNQKQSFMTKKIDKIVDSHEQKLRKRINDRKLKTLTCKSKSEVFTEDEIGGVGDFDIGTGEHEGFVKIEDKSMQKRLGNLNTIEVDLKKHETIINSQQKHQKPNNFNQINHSNWLPSSNLQRKNRKLRRISSLESKRSKLFSSSPTNENEPDSPTRRKISADIHQISKMSMEQGKMQQISKYVNELKQKKKSDIKE